MSRSIALGVRLLMLSVATDLVQPWWQQLGGSLVETREGKHTEKKVRVNGGWVRSTQSIRLRHSREANFENEEKEQESNQTSKLRDQLSRAREGGQDECGARGEREF